MEYVLIGLAVAIGFYLAPFVITIVFGVIIAVVATIMTVFKTLFGK